MTSTQQHQEMNNTNNNSKYNDDHTVIVNGATTTVGALKMKKSNLSYHELVTQMIPHHLERQIKMIDTRCAVPLEDVILPIKPKKRKKGEFHEQPNDNDNNNNSSNEFGGLSSSFNSHGDDTYNGDNMNNMNNMNNDDYNNGENNSDDDEFRFNNNRESLDSSNDDSINSSSGGGGANHQGNEYSSSHHRNRNGSQMTVCSVASGATSQMSMNNSIRKSNNNKRIRHLNHAEQYFIQSLDIKGIVKGVRYTEFSDMLNMKFQDKMYHYLKDQVITAYRENTLQYTGKAKEFVMDSFANETRAKADLRLQLFKILNKENLRKLSMKCSKEIKMEMEMETKRMEEKQKKLEYYNNLHKEGRSESEVETTLTPSITTTTTTAATTTTITTTSTASSSSTKTASSSTKTKKATDPMVQKKSLKTQGKKKSNIKPFSSNANDNGTTNANNTNDNDNNQKKINKKIKFIKTPQGEEVDEEMLIERNLKIIDTVYKQEKLKLKRKNARINNASTKQEGDMETLSWLKKEVDNDELEIQDQLAELPQFETSEIAINLPKRSDTIFSAMMKNNLWDDNRNRFADEEYRNPPERMMLEDQSIVEFQPRYLMSIVEKLGDNLGMQSILLDYPPSKEVTQGISPEEDPESRCRPSFYDALTRTPKDGQDILIEKPKPIIPLYFIEDMDDESLFMCPPEPDYLIIKGEERGYAEFNDEFQKLETDVHGAVAEIASWQEVFDSDVIQNDMKNGFKFSADESIASRYLNGTLFDVMHKNDYKNENSFDPKITNTKIFQGVYDRCLKDLEHIENGFVSEEKVVSKEKDKSLKNKKKKEKDIVKEEVQKEPTYQQKVIEEDDLNNTMMKICNLIDEIYNIKKKIFDGPDVEELLINYKVHGKKFTSNTSADHLANSLRADKMELDGGNLTDFLLTKFPALQHFMANWKKLNLPKLYIEHLLHKYSQIDTGEYISFKAAWDNAVTGIDQFDKSLKHVFETAERTLLVSVKPQSVYHHLNNVISTFNKHAYELKVALIELFYTTNGDHIITINEGSKIEHVKDQIENVFNCYHIQLQAYMATQLNL